MIKPAMRRTWRSRDTVQFGVTPEQAVVVEQVDEGSAELLDLLDGTRSLERLRTEAARLGVSGRRVDRLLRVLGEGGVLDDAKATADALHDLPPAERERLRPDLSSLAMLHPAPGAGAARFLGRAGATVHVRGAGRVGAAVATVLAAAGIGRVEVTDSGRVEPWDISPCGMTVRERGLRRGAAARAAMRRTGTAVVRRGTRSRVGLVVLAPRDGLRAYTPEPLESRSLLDAGVPHLYAGVLEGTGFVGPLVVPRSSRWACGECVTRHHGDADPAWPRILTQLGSGRPGPLPACDVALSSTVAGLAALHALMFLDGGVPASLGGRVEVSLADSGVIVRPVSPHPGCWGARKPGHGRESVGSAPAVVRDQQVTMEVDGGVAHQGAPPIGE
ncbi:ThiF family adenylyltransferase [Wenjunlia vitaminophila]|nr:ThiF family adenylyltransferase [Wenjunlia vitaminophila]